MAISDQAWLQRFFAPPNELAWSAIEARSESVEVAQVLRPWLELIETDTQAPVILPMVRRGAIAGWYAVARSPERADQLRETLKAWLGLTWLASFGAVKAGKDDLADTLRNQFGGTVFRFTGGTAAANKNVSELLTSLAALLAERPERMALEKRPVGVVRRDFDRALLLQDEARATDLLEELKHSGRLNDENLRYLEVRLRAGLGLWSQIAHDHWLIRTLSDLILPPQTLTDLIEALYRVHIEGLEDGDAGPLKEAFQTQIGERYPRLFSSRRGIRTPRVVKAFLLFEQSLSTPNVAIVAELAGLLPPQDRAKAAFAALTQPPAQAPETDNLGERADEAFDDHQFDRAFLLYLRLPPTKRTLARLVMAASFINTSEANTELQAALSSNPDLTQQLPDALKAKIEALSKVTAPLETDTASKEEQAAVRAADSAAPALEIPSGWMAWSEALSVGQPLPLPADALVTWDSAEIAQNPAAEERFAELIGNASGSAAEMARQAIPSLYAAFLSGRPQGTSASNAIGMTLFVLIALDESLSEVDLDLLAQLLEDLMRSGPSEADYVSLVDILSDVQGRVTSLLHLGWSLATLETLAITPAPSANAKEARLRLALQVIAESQSFEHRVPTEERHAFKLIAQDFGLDESALGKLAEINFSGEAADLPDLSGKTIGIYTLVETAGARAKAALEAMFPGVSVTLNADQVATSRLASLAKNSDFFVFAWRSSSHAAYYCVRDAMGDREPIMPQGKGTASILRAVTAALG